MQGVCLRHCMHYVSKQSQANRPRDRPRAASFPAYSSLAAFFNPRTTWSLFRQFLQSHGLCELLLPQLDLPLSRRVSRRVSLRGLQRFPPQHLHDVRSIVRGSNEAELRNKPARRRCRRLFARTELGSYTHTIAASTTAGTTISTMVTDDAKTTVFAPDI